MEPQLRGYQLIGDNMLFRFAEQVLELPRKKSKTSVFIGLCISGVKTGDLLEKVKTELHPVPEKVILMVGTSDILQKTDSTLLRKHLHELICHLRFEIKVQKLIVNTIPPVPRVADRPYHWKTLKEFNEHIRTFHTGDDIIVVDAYPSFIKNNNFYYKPSPIMRPLPSSSRTMSNLPAFLSADHPRKSGEFKSHNDSQDHLIDSYQGGSYVEDIELKYFEECFENKLTRPDNIHLNRKGLFLIGRLILDVIDKVENA